ncbi:MAG: FecR domain-containing protein [Odoribacter sp.]
MWLNSESELVYPVKFIGPRREVSMKGEVCFEVAQNESQPFVVKTRETTVTVLGTLFNMEAYPESQQVTTTLVRGKVEIGTGQVRKF